MTASPLTIAHVKDHFLPRSETFIYNLIQAVPEATPVVLDRYRQQNSDIFPIAHHISSAARFGQWAGVCERAALRYLGRSFYLETAVARRPISLLHAHFGQLGALFAPIAQRRRLPLVVSFYGKDASVFLSEPTWAPRFARLWQTSARVLALGPAMRRQLAAAGCPPAKITLLPLTLDVNRFSRCAYTPPQPREPIKLLTIGRLIPKKGVDILLKSLSILQTSGAPAWQLCIAGDGPQRQALQSLAQTLGLSERVHFLGWLSPDQVAAQLAQTHLFVLASRDDPVTAETEGTPTVLLEAQACGVPVVSTHHADIPFIAPHGKSGLLAAAGDTNALAGVLAEMLARKDEWATMGQNGKRRVAQMHDMRVVGPQLLQIYRECAA